jgi:undecaprenyl-diphosphatase
MIDPDRAIHDALNSHVLPSYHWFFATFTWLGSASLWILILAGCIFINRWRKIAAVLIIVIAFNVLINEDLKEIVHRIRPDNVVVGGYLVVHSYSFPSGHTQTAFAIATVLSAFLARRYNVITYLLAAGVGMSRIYLGVHYLSDVVAGAAVGIVLGVLAVCCLEKLGLYGGNGILEIAPRSRKKATGTSRYDAAEIKYAVIILATGFLAANVAILLSCYMLSLAVAGIMYVALLLLPTMRKIRSKSD